VNHQFTFPGVPGRAALHLGISLPDNKGCSTVYLYPEGEAVGNDINNPHGFAFIGEVLRTTSGGRILKLRGAGWHDLGWQRRTRKGIALAAACILAGFTVRYQPGGFADVIEEHQPVAAL